jgi:hypothetical protein
MREQVLGVGRVAFGLLAAVALAVQGWHSASAGASMVNFFSYFTNLSNLAGAVVLLAGGTLVLRGRPGLPDWLRGAVVVYLVVTGVVYALLLVDYHLPLALEWVNDVVHKVMPAVYVADWLLDPPRRRIDYRVALGWLGFPLVYLVYTLIRGRFAHWYPYPFLDPTRPHGYERVAGACVLVAVMFLVTVAAVGWAGNRRRGEILVPG